MIELTKRQETAQSIYIQRKKEDRCPHCGGERDDPQKTYCTKCQALATKATRDRGDRFEAKGLCRRCGEESMRPGRKLGEACAEKARKARKKFRRSKGIQKRVVRVGPRVYSTPTQAQRDHKISLQRKKRRVKSEAKPITKKSQQAPITKKSRQTPTNNHQSSKIQTGEKASPEYQAVWDAWIVRMRSERAATSDHEAEQDTLLELSQ